MDWTLFESASTIKEDTIFLAFYTFSNVLHILLLYVVVSYWMKNWFWKRLSDANCCWGWLIILMFALEGAFRVLIFRDKPGWEGLNATLPWMQFVLCGLWSFSLSQAWVAEGEKQKLKQMDDDDDFKGPMRPTGV